LRAHCKKKHGYDPAPVSPELKYGFMKECDGQVSQAGKLDGKLGTALNRALSKTKLSEELRTGDKVTWAASDFSAEFAINKLLDDNIFLSKKEFEAISGYLCPRCMTFDYSYIRRIGVDLNEEKKHRCNTAALIRADNIKDRRIKGELLTDIELQAINHLYELAISQFGPALRLVAKRLPFVVMPQESLIGKTYAPAIIADSIHSSGYAWLERAIIDREYCLEEQQLWEFIYNTRSTYSIAVTLKGDYSGAYLLQLKSTASNGMDLQIPAVPSPDATVSLL